MNGIDQRADGRRGKGSRDTILSVIEPRLRELMVAGASRPLGKLACKINRVGVLRLEFVREPQSTVTRVEIREEGKLLFVILLDPDPPGKHLGGKVHVITWKRGDWETRLFRGTRRS